jgi:5-methylcytosine-specific restriction protein A
MHAEAAAARDRARRRARDKTRDRTMGAMYDGRWRKARAAFLKQNPMCSCCSQPATVVDHMTPHRGDVRVFWDRSNWRGMCHHCHSKKTAKSDGGFGNPRSAFDLNY